MRRLVTAIAAISAAAVCDASASALFSAKELRCATRVGTVTAWERGRPVSKASDSATSFTVLDIDLTRGLATLAGSAGQGQVRVIRTDSTLSFIELAANGAVFVDTIFASTLSGLGPGRFALVSSRHNPLIGDPLSSQFHGACEITR